MNQEKLILSNLNKTWILDLDGTIFVHNGHLKGEDQILPGVKEFFNKIPNDDMVIILTSRNLEFEQITKKTLHKYGLKYEYIIFNAPLGERILINDIKPRGLKTAYSLNLARNSGINYEISIDDNK